MLDTLKSYGIRGIEAIYSRNHGTDEAFVRKLADEYELFITGGSDFHGSAKPGLDLGTGYGGLFVPECRAGASETAASRRIGVPF